MAFGGKKAAPFGSGPGKSRKKSSTKTAKGKPKKGVNPFAAKKSGKK